MEQRRPCKQQTDEACYVVSLLLSRASKVNKLTVKVEKSTGLSSALMQTWMAWMPMRLRNNPCCLFFCLFVFSCLSPPRPHWTHFKHTGQWDGSLEASTNISPYVNLKFSIKIYYSDNQNKQEEQKSSSHHLRLNLICWIDWTFRSVPETPLRDVLGESLNRGIMDRAALCRYLQGGSLWQQLNQSVY